MEAKKYRNSIAPSVLKLFTSHRHGINLVKHQVDSYNEFISYRIRNIIQACNNIEITHEYMPDINCHQHKLTLTFSNPRICRPSIMEKDGASTVLTPQECRLRGINYSAALYVDLHVVCKSVISKTPMEVSSNEKFINNVPIGKIPIMVNSKFCTTHSLPIVSQGDCRYDYGGYFIVNGTEKVIVSNDRMAENQTFVFVNNKANTTYSHCAEIRSVAWNNDGSGTVKSLVLRASLRPNQFGRYIRVALPHAKQDVPLVMLFRALGIESDKDIVDMVTVNCDDNEKAIMQNQLTGSIAEGADIRCSRDAVESLIRTMNFGLSTASLPQRVEYVRNVISRDILPHVGKDYIPKAIYLAYMVRKLLRCMCGIDESDDRDSYVNKRVDTPGVMLSSLFRVHYVRMLKEMRNSISREISTGAWKPSGGFINVINKINIVKHVKSSIVESGMKYALATGNWNVKGMTGIASSSGGGMAKAATSANAAAASNSRKQGVAQVLNRLTYMATISHLRRINTPMEKNGKMVQPRKLHNTQWGVICPSETPEGASVGLVKNMAIMASITVYSDPETVLSHIMRLGMVKDVINHGCAPVFLNGKVVGCHPDPVFLVNKLRCLRRSCVINVFTSIVLNTRDKTISINTEAGRIVRPLWVISRDGRLCLTENDIQSISNEKMPWWELVWKGMIEYLDVAEASTMMIALSYEDLTKGKRGVLHSFSYTHLEIDPACILGVSASCIPFSDHNQAPRNTYQCLHPEETVLMSDGSKKPIKNIVVGDEVITFDPVTKFTTTTRVVHHYVRPSENPVYELETISGRTIRATSNHNFMTTDGWKAVQDFDAGTRIGIFVNPEPVSSYIRDDFVIMDDYDFKKQLLSWGGHQASMVDKDTDVLRRVLPLTGTHKLLPVFARMIGYVISALHTGEKCGLSKRSLIATFNSLHDAEMFENDVEAIGMIREPPIRCADRGSCWNVYHHDEPFVELMFMLSESDDDHLLDEVPSWVMRCSLLVKREFLSGYLARNSRKEVLLPKQVIDLLKEFGSLDDTVNFFDFVGFRYNYKKCTAGGMAAEYLRAPHADWHPGIIAHGQAIFVPIKRICRTNDRWISDITVESDTHSFIAGSNFLSSNSAMLKQAIGINVSNFDSRFDTVNHILHYPQKALVQTRCAQLLHADKLPNGINAIVAIMTFTGYNQEDSVLINRSAIDRGMFVSTMYKTFREQNNRNHANGEEEFFGKPDPSLTRNMKPCNYDHLTDDGFARENARIHEGDIIIGKCMPQKVGATLMYRDNSVQYRGTDIAFVDRNCYSDNYFNTTNGDGYTFAKTRVRCIMNPVVGDKFSSRHAQKGTCGLILDECDMPFTEHGMVPDIIMNSHAIPSRMTVAQLMEGVLSKACCINGKDGNGSAFQCDDFRTVGDVLKSAGYNEHGDEVMYDPRSGRKMNVRVFVTPTYYQRLKHLSSQKVHSRAANGPVVLLTRQPTEGRSREGALRQGNMETHVLIAHGVTQFMKERLMECSDNYKVFVCQHCGLIADVNPDRGMYSCRGCGDSVAFSEVRIPYAAKLLLHEMMALGVGSRIKNV